MSDASGPGGAGETGRLRVVQAGVGGMGRTWVRAIAGSADVEPVALADPNADALAAAGEALGVPPSRRFADLDAALSRPRRRRGRRGDHRHAPRPSTPSTPASPSAAACTC